MTTKINSAFVSGIESFPVPVECHIESGLPQTTIIGVSDAGELAEIVRCAIKASGYEYPRGRVVVQIYPKLPCATNLIQAAVAVAILVESGQLAASLFEDKLVVGELTLSGSWHAARGTINAYRMARQMGMRFVTNPTLKSLRNGVMSGEDIVVEKHESQGDFADLVGCEPLKRALVVAAAGNHPLMAVGTDADTVMAQAAHLMPTVLEPLDEDELMELAGIYSAGRAYFNGVRPVRMPHHSVSQAGMIGGGRPVMPGEVTLAHHGVLYLGELAEYDNKVLGNMRPIMDDKQVRIVRADGIYDMPADFLLLASAKPCPCGHLGDPHRECRCSPQSIMRYQARLGGAIRDKFHMSIDVIGNYAFDHLMTSADMKSMVARAKDFARNRGDAPNEFTEGGRDTCAALIHRIGLNELSKTHIVEVARTIADIDESERIDVGHVLEAASYMVR